MANCYSPTAPTATELAEALAARLITKTEAALLATRYPGNFSSTPEASAWRAAYAKLPSNSYGICVLQSSLSTANPSSSAGEFEESVSGLGEATTRVEELKPAALAIYLMRYQRGGGRIKKPVSAWYADAYKGKRLTA